ncbi:hypothetical protein [Chloroflexus sp. Y-396-1]|uniref:hypothetical protein n=1 Tax=Chloroflexus sp. Y-396-1 TaxID=867845 RepID=UPI00048B3D1E|nr:hypothetical protein [Chloroflexus sp. Y-396-1]
MHWNRVVPVSTPVQYRWFLSEPPIRNALEQGCTGFNAGAVPLVSERAANPQCAKKGLHRFQPVQYRWFLSEPPIRNALKKGCTGFNRCSTAGFQCSVVEVSVLYQLHRFQRRCSTAGF